MKPTSFLRIASLAALTSTLIPHPASGQTPTIAFFAANGELICTNLPPGSLASVEWASSADGPWTNSWAGLAALPVDATGTLQVRVPMLFRVRADAAPPGLVAIPDSAFVRGDTWAEGNPREVPTHSAHVSSLFMDRHEVTKGLWDSVCAWAETQGYDLGNLGVGKAPDHPVHSITWYDAVKWCNARSEMEGRVPAYYTDAAWAEVYRVGQVDVRNAWVQWNAGYRLPTEAEWEKAARGGSAGRRFPWADGDTITHSHANYYSDSDSPYDLSPTRGHHPDFASGGYPYTSTVGSFAPNGYGLHDMTGNVWEWCWDWEDEYCSTSQIDPRGPDAGTHRTMRGGGWDHYAYHGRAAYRYSNEPASSGGVHGADCGFRTVLPIND